MFEKHLLTTTREKAKLKQTLISNMVTSNETINQHLNLSLFSIRFSQSVWLLISGAGDAVCGVV